MLGNGCAAFIPGRTPLVGLELAITRGWLWKHESGTYVKFTQAGADLFESPVSHPAGRGFFGSVSDR